MVPGLFPVVPPQPSAPARRKARWLLFGLLGLPLTLAVPDAASSEPLPGIRRLGADEGLPPTRLHDLRQTPDGLLWIATHQGLLRFDGRAFEVFSRQRFPSMIDDQINALAFDPEGYLFLGSQRSGLLRFTGQAFWAVSRPDLGTESWRVDRLAEGPDGTLWVGDSGQLWRLARGGNSVKPSLPGVTVHDLSFDNRGNLWIATNKGLFRRQGSALLPLSLPFGVRADNGGKIALDLQDDLWVALLPRGLMRLRGELGRGGLPQDIVEEKFLEERQISAMLVDRRGAIWFGTDRGLIRHQNGAYETLSGPTGTISSLLEDRDGSLWAGGNGELWQFFQANSRPSPAPPLLARAEVDGKEVLLLRQVEFEAGSHQLRWQLSAAALRPEQKPTFRYRFDGMDDDWIDAPTGLVERRLPPGQRLFRAQASFEGVWHPEELVISLNVPRPAWQNPILWVAGVATLLLLAWVGHHILAHFRAAREDDDD